MKKLTDVPIGTYKLRRWFEIWKAGGYISVSLSPLGGKCFSWYPCQASVDTPDTCVSLNVDGTVRWLKECGFQSFDPAHAVPFILFLEEHLLKEKK